MTHSMNRRAALGSIARAGALILPTAGLAATAVPAAALVSSPNNISALIEAHRAAWRAFEDHCTIESEAEPSDPAYEAIQRENNRLNDAEAEALFALCAYRPTDMQEVRERGDYLAEFITHNQLSEEQEEALFASYCAPRGNGLVAT